MTETLPPPDRIDVLALEVRGLAAEMRAGFAEIRIGFARVETRIAAVDAKVETVVDALAGLRNAYRGHTHD